jgi:lipopolysaccharide biosynthesis glycosyltransferase
MKMNVIPIAVSFDKNFVLPASVSLYSLIVNANKNTYYKIYVLTSDSDVASLLDLDALYRLSGKFEINFIYVGNAFDNAYEVREITKASYYRLLLPDLLPDCDKIIYMDVDTIIQSDLSDFFSVDLSKSYLAAFLDYGMSRDKNGKKYIHDVLNIDTETYIQAGFMILNLSRLRECSIVDNFKSLSYNNYIFQDQDIINIACVNNIEILPCYKNIMVQSYDIQSSYPQDYVGVDMSSSMKTAFIHYNGPKPWKTIAINDDIWWQYYRQSPFFNYDFYISFQKEKMNALDRGIKDRLRRMIRRIITKLHR